MKNLSKFFKKRSLAIFATLLSQSAWASNNGGSSMPWDSPLQTVETALSGTTAHVAILIAIVISGIGFAIGEHGSLMRKGMAVIVGGSIAVGAASLYTTLGIGGALV